MIRILICLLLIFQVNAQTCTNCNICTTSPTIYLGTNTSTSNPTQAVYVGAFSGSLYAGHPTPSPATQTVDYFNGSDTIRIGSVGAGSMQTQTIEIGTTASALRICNDRTGLTQVQSCEIGPSTTDSPNSVVGIGARAGNVYIGNNAVFTVGIGTGQVPVIYLGKGSPSPTPQTTFVGYSSTTVNIADLSLVTTISTGPTAGPLTIGTTGTPSTQSITINGASILIGQSSPSTKIAYGPTAGPIFIGQESPSPTPPTQGVSVCEWCQNALFGRNAVSSIQIGTQTTAPVSLGRSSRTTGSQIIYIGEYLNLSPTAAPTQSIRVGSMAGGGVLVANDATAGSITIGSPTSNPTQSITIGEASGGDLRIGAAKPSGNTFIVAYSNADLYLGRVGHSSSNQNVIIGQNNAPPTSPSPVPPPVQTITIGTYSSSILIGLGNNDASFVIGKNSPTGAPSPSQNQEAYLFEYSRNVRIGNRLPGTLELGRFAGIVETGIESGLNRIGTSQTSAQSTIIGNSPSGAPSSSSSRLQLRGLYHYYYSADCPGSASGYLNQICTTNAATNGASGSVSVTTGYDTSNGRWYPPEVGTYSVSFTALALGSGDSYIYITRAFGGTEVTVTSAKATTNTQMTIMSFVTFNTVGGGNYLLVGADRTATTATFSRVNFVRES